MPWQWFQLNRGMLQTLPFLYQDDDQMARVRCQLSGWSNVTKKSPSGGNIERNYLQNNYVTTKMTFDSENKIIS